MSPLSVVVTIIFSFSVGAFWLGWLISRFQRPKFSILHRRISELTEERDSALRAYEESLDACGTSECRFVAEAKAGVPNV